MRYNVIDLKHTNQFGEEQLLNKICVKRTQCVRLEQQFEQSIEEHFELLVLQIAFDEHFLHPFDFSTLTGVHLDVV